MKKPQNLTRWQRFGRDHPFRAGVCSGLALAAFVLCADVIAREVFGQGFYGVQKLAVYCCAVAGALGMSVVVHAGGHLRITAIDNPASLQLRDALVEINLELE